MPAVVRPSNAEGAASEEEAFLEDLLHMEAEGHRFLPDRLAVVEWCERHSLAVLTVAGVAVLGPVIGAICFG